MYFGMYKDSPNFSTLLFVTPNRILFRQMIRFVGSRLDGAIGIIQIDIRRNEFWQIEIRPRRNEV